MEWTYEKITQWFERYFEDVCRYQGSLETVPNLRRYFSEDLKLRMYTSPSSPPAVTMSRDDLLFSFIHPGLQEDIKPKQMVVDVEKRIVAVRFEIRFKDMPSKTEWPPLEASAHYELVSDENGGIKISRIHYWTEKLPGDLFEFWGRRREEELRRSALAIIASGGSE